MSDNIRYNWLLDLYGELLTIRQKDVLELHYGDDLSLSEIAEELEISRQAVHDSIQRGEAKLNELEEKLGFVAMHSKIQDVINKARTIAVGKLKDESADNKLKQVIKLLDTIDMDK